MMPAAGLLGLAGDRRVLIGRAFDRVDDQHRHVRLLDRAPRDHHADALRAGPLRATRPGRRMPAVSTIRNVRLCHLSTRIDRVARRPRHVADDRALFAQQPIEQRRLADVRPADDGDARSPAGIARGAVARRSGRRAMISSSRSPTPVAVLGGDLDHRLEARAGRTRRARPRARLSSVLLTAISTGAVDRPQAPRRSPGRPARALPARRRRRRPRRPSRAPGGPASTTSSCSGSSLAPNIPPVSTSVNVTALPLGRLRDDVAGRAGDGGDDRPAGIGDAVEKRGFSDVRTADQHDRWAAPRRVSVACEKSS